MNILHLLSATDSYDTLVGTIDVVRRLSAAGHHCVIASMWDLSMLAYDTSGLSAEVLLSDVRKPWQLRSLYSKARSIIKKNNIEIIHAHSPLMCWLALFIARADGIPFVATCHDFYSRRYFNESLASARTVIVHHQAVGVYLVEAFQLSSERLRFIKEPIDLRTFQFFSYDTRSKTDFTIALAWPLRAHAGYEPFFKGMVKATRIIPNVKIMVADKLPQSSYHYKMDLEFFIRQLGLSSYVEFFDASALDLKVLSAATLLVSPFLREACHTRALLEAYAYGTVVIASRVAGISEIAADDSTAMVVAPNDHNAFTDGVVGLLRDFGRLRAIASAARKKVEEGHNVDGCLGAFVDVYQQAIQHKRILIINVGTIAQATWAVPALRLLKKHMHNAHITLLSRFSLRSLFQRCPYIDELVSYGDGYRTVRLANYVKIISMLVRQQFDIVVDFTNTVSTHLLSHASFAHKRYGSSNAKIRRIIDRVKRCGVKNEDPIRQRFSVIRPLVEHESKEDTVEFWTSKEDASFVDRLFNEHWIGQTKIIGLDFSFSRNPLTRASSLERLAFLCDTLAEADMRVVLVGFKRGTVEGSKFQRQLRSKPIVAPADISITQFISLIKRCDCYISSNRDVLELVSMLRVPSLMLSSAKKMLPASSASNQTSRREVLTSKDISSAMAHRHKRRPKTGTVARNCIVDKVNRLIEVRQ